MYGCFESGVVEKVYRFLQGVGVEAYISRTGRTAISESACLQYNRLASTMSLVRLIPWHGSVSETSTSVSRGLECLACWRDSQSQAGLR